LGLGGFKKTNTPPPHGGAWGWLKKTNSPPSQGGAGVVKKNKLPTFARRGLGVVKKNNERYVSILALFSYTKQPKEPIQRTKPKTIF
jgi:hypothetical protein